MSVIVFDHVSKWYGQISGVNDVSVAVPPGITGLLGPNGAGKSTFMKLVTGQLRPSQGQVTVLGETVWNHPVAFEQIGFCPEQDAFYERMTALDWVSGLLRVHGYEATAATAAARDALAAVDLSSVEGRRIAGFSKGMRQRVKLAQAIAHAPALLVLDEPLTGMDPVVRAQTIRLIRQMGDAGRSVLVSSHVLHEVEAMTSSIVLLHQGRVLAEGDVHQIRALIDAHPHTVRIVAERPRVLAAALVEADDVHSVHVTADALQVQTTAPDQFYARLTALAADGAVGAVREISSPDDNLQAVFSYLVK